MGEQQAPTTSKGERKLSLTLIIENRISYQGWFDPEDMLGTISEIALDMTRYEDLPLKDMELTNRSGKRISFDTKLKDSGAMDRDTLYLTLKEHTQRTN